MAKKQVYGLKSGRGLCPVCGEPVQNIKMVGSTLNGANSLKFNESVVKVCKCPDKTIEAYSKK